VEEATEDHMGIDGEDQQYPALFDLYDAMQFPVPECRHLGRTDYEPHVGPEKPAVAVDMAADDSPFRRWMSVLKRRHLHRHKDTEAGTPNAPVPPADVSAPMLSSFLHVHVPEPLQQYSSSVSSSLDYVTAMKSASITVAGTSIAGNSDVARLQARIRLGKRSSTFSDVRKSTDSNSGSNAGNLGPILDESAWLRSIQRRKIVEEIISSEESYICDLKVLINVSRSLC
jgi:hypothetical protein